MSAGYVQGREGARYQIEAPERRSGDKGGSTVALGAWQDRGVPVRVEDASLDVRLRSKADASARSRSCAGHVDGLTAVREFGRRRRDVAQGAP